MAETGGRSVGEGGAGRRSVTMSDVAKRAGVSMTTVSRVFSEKGDGQVRPRTRRRVLRAADELGYRAHWAARALARQRSGLIGALVPDLGGGFVAEVIDGLMRECREAGYEPILAHCGTGHLDIGRALDHLLQMRVEGIVFRPRTSLPIEDETVARALHQVPAVLVDLGVEGLSLPLVTSDDADGVRQAVDYLVSLGHTRIGHLAGAFWASSGTIRLQAFQERMIEHGLHVPGEYVVGYDWRYSRAIEPSCRLLEARPRPTAVVAASDDGAAALIQVARQTGLRVPDDLAVIGFSDTMLCHTWSPSLTTVRQPKGELGQEALRVLLRIIAGETPEPDRLLHLLPTELVVRESCGRGPKGVPEVGAPIHGLNSSSGPALPEANV